MTTQPIDQVVDDEEFTQVISHGVNIVDSDRAEAFEKAQEITGHKEMDQADKLPGRPRMDRASAQFVAARIGGADLKLQIVPDDLLVFAKSIEAPFVAMRKLMGEDWSPDLVARTLHFAALPTDVRERMAKFATYGIATQYSSMPKSDVVREVLAARPMAQYARLAGMCLMAALLGIDDSEAHFSDEPDGA